MTQRPHPEALLDAAVRYANHGIPILPDQLVNRRPDPAAGPPVCACRRRDCPALPIHGPRRLDRDNDAWHTSHVGRWWTANPDAAIATVAGAAFDVIEIHAAILYLAPGSLILLPPSRLDDGQSVTWLRPLDPTTALPDGAETFWALVELPANQQLADPNVYTFPAALRQPHHAGARW